MPSTGCGGPWIALATDDRLAGLVLEEVHGVRRVVPEQVIRPGARLAERVRVAATEEIGLHVHLLDPELAAPDAPMDPLVRRVESPRVTDHADAAGVMLHACDLARVRPVVGERDLDLHVLAGPHALDGLRGVQLRRCRQDHGVDAGPVERLGELRGDVRDAEFRGNFARLLERAADQRDDLDAADDLDRLQVLLAKAPAPARMIFMRFPG